MVSVPVVDNRKEEETWPSQTIKSSPLQKLINIMEVHRLRTCPERAHSRNKMRVNSLSHQFGNFPAEECRILRMISIQS